MLYVGATPVALKVIGLLAIPLPETAAVRVFGPGLLPTVQLPTVATPLVAVACVAPVTLPPPVATVKVTCALATGMPAVSSTSTAGAKLRAYPIRPVWPSPARTATDAGGPGVFTVARNLTVSGRPDTVTIAYSVSVPGLTSTVHPPTVATPVTKVCGVTGGVTLPLFWPAAHVTVTLATGLPDSSLTRTLGWCA